MKTVLTTLLVVFLMASNLTVQAQLNKDNANSTIMKCLKAIADSKANNETYLELADAYFLLEEMNNAANWYKYALIFEEFKDTRHYVKYANALEETDQKIEARKIYVKLNSMGATAVFNPMVSAPKVNTVNHDYTISRVIINSEQMDYAPSFYENKLIFSSSRIETGIGKNNVDRWTGKLHKNLYHATVTEKGEVDERVSRFTIEGSKALHGSTTAFTKDGRTVYFTKEIYKDRKRGGNKSLFKIYQARLENGKWKNVLELPFNTNHYSSAHPALTPDGSELYFVSDRAGSYGVSDIWKVKVFDDGRSFGLPEKLGSNINTKGKDSFPFISDSGKLYFSSDGHDGHGGMDIFVADISTTTIDQVEVRNLGKPINSSADDITFIIDENVKKGYFSSNRENGIGKDDIYSFQEKKSELAVE